MKKILVCGAGGFIGGHLVNQLKKEGFWVRGVDIKENEYGNNFCDEFILGDLRDPKVADEVTKEIEEVYQLAADMGGAGYIFTGEHDADVMHNSAMCNLNVLNASQHSGVNKIFYSSSACMYPEYNQMDPNNPKCSEESAYPAAPDSEYGWEKLFSERLYLSYYRNYNLQVRIARFHNIFGVKGTWHGGKEKAPAALCRKVAETPDGGAIEVWGDGAQTRSFLYIDECVEAVRRLMNSDFTGPVNIGSEEMISINDLAKMIIKISGKNISINNIAGPTGVRGRNSDNKLIREKLNWEPSQPLIDGITLTYNWILKQLQQNTSAYIVPITETSGVLG
jgi:nucleoside-diphosphate-sugar epimerase